ncbi:metallophosphoesterase [Alteromonas ponticola]|uniref:Metallophosphoesterase n=1 Tax=Alteromonas aquimaris TaxID=2998417 RepID=A0ABT3P8P5_9ALTE|nr:metallophosphoesterase [Alteromonas aquimaris]MCW8109099.1 metallophosphoesterase [Alteromonas aquimaris]
MKTLLRYLGHFAAVSTVLLVLGFALLISQHGTVGFPADPLAKTVGNEGPHVFFDGGKVRAEYIRGNRDDGFYKETVPLQLEGSNQLDVYFPLTDSTFQVDYIPVVETPPSIYSDNAPILAISDLEGNLATFIDFLKAHKVINNDNQWQFGNGHLVLIGDMVDRGYSTTPLLWFIYKLEQEAQLAGGKLHYIIGNHEIKNLQGNFYSAADKYFAIAGILERQQYELFGPNAAIGRWLASKNVIENINGHLFVHGGIHPDISKLGMSIDEINAVVREHFRQFYYPRATLQNHIDLLTSTITGPAWYRGYFKDDVDTHHVKQSLEAFKAKAVIVGHTLQFKVNALFDNQVFAIDVKHPDDYNVSFPTKSSEGLLIENGSYYRLMEDGERVAI